MSKKSSWAKSGPLSAEEKEFIKEYVEHLSLDEIAVRLNRRRDFLEKYCQKHKLSYSRTLPSLSGWEHDSEEIRELKAQLRRKNFYSEVRTTLLDEDEVRYFENRWVEYSQQFRGDLLATEEIQMKQMIVLDILMNRLLKEQKKHNDSIRDLEKILERYYTEKEANGFLENVDRIAATEEQLAGMRNSLGSYNTHLEKLLAKHNDILEKLKGTREQRVKIIEESKKNWPGLLKFLEEEENRQFHGQHITLMKNLVDETRKEFHQYHEYTDKSICPLIMTAESVKLNAKLDAEAKKIKEETLQDSP